MEWVYRIIAIAIVLILIAVFLVTFVWYKRTPVPKGCEKEASAEACSLCPKASSCSLNIYADKNPPKEETK